MIIFVSPLPVRNRAEELGVKLTLSNANLTLNLFKLYIQYTLIYKTCLTQAMNVADVHLILILWFTL